MAAFSANRLVCSAIPLITSSTEPTLLESDSKRAITSAVSRTFSASCWILVTVCCTIWRPSLAAVVASLASLAACAALCATPSTEPLIVSTARLALVADFCCTSMVRWVSSVTPRKFCARFDSGKLASTTSRTTPCSLSMNWLNQYTNSPISSSLLVSMRTVRSPFSWAISLRERTTSSILCLMPRTIGTAVPNSNIVTTTAKMTPVLINEVLALSVFLNASSNAACWASRNWDIAAMAPSYDWFIWAESSPKRLKSAVPLTIDCDTS